MGKTDWASVSLPNSLMEKLDESLKSDKVNELGVSSRAQIITLLVKKFLDNDIDLLIKPNDIQNSIHKQLEKKLDGRFEELLKILPDIMLELVPVKAQNEKMKAMQKKNIMKKLLLSQSIPENMKKKLFSIEKE